MERADKLCGQEVDLGLDAAILTAGDYEGVNAPMAESGWRSMMKKIDRYSDM